MSFTRATAFATTLFVLHAFAAAQQPALTQIEQGLQSPAGDASAPLGYVGFEPDEDITDGKGVHVKGVRPGTPADASGLKKGDLIINIDGRPIRNLDDYDATVKRPVGAKLVFIVERAGKPQSLAVTLGARPPAVAAAEPASSDPPSSAPSLSPPGPAPSLSPPSSAPSFPSAPGSSAPGLQPPSTLPPPSAFETTPRTGGITAQPLDSTGPLSAPGLSSPPSTLTAPGAVGSGNASLGIRVIPSEQAPGVARTHRGAYIEKVNAGSPAAAAGVPVGAVIVQFDGRTISSDDDLVAAIRASRPGQEIELTYFDNTDRLGKKMIRLGEAGAPPASTPPATGGLGGFGGGFGGATTPPADNSTRPGLGGSNRPLLNRVERMAENLGRGSGLVAPIGPTGPTTVYDPLAMAALQKTVAELTAAVNALDARLQTLERRGGGTEGSAPAPLGSPSFSPPSPSFGSPQTPGFSSPQPSLTPGFGAPSTLPGTNP